MSAESGRVVAIVASGGTGKRMGREIPKQFIEIAGKPVLVHTLHQFEICDAIDEVILTSPEDATQATCELLTEFGLDKVSQVVAGGKERQDTIANALACVDEQVDVILVHDGVRPFVTQDQIGAVIDAVQKTGAAILAIPSVNTIKRVEDGKVVATLDRSQLWQVQTPQGFRADWLREAYQMANEVSMPATDDASLVEAAGYPVHIVEGDDRNIKITSPLDLKIAEVLIEEMQ